MFNESLGRDGHLSRRWVLARTLMQSCGMGADAMHPRPSRIGEPIGRRSHELGRNGLASVRPSLAAMVDPTLNEDVNVAGVFAGAHRVLWWRGGYGHVWLARMGAMANLKGPQACPYCSHRRLLRVFNNLATVSL